MSKLFSGRRLFSCTLPVALIFLGSLSSGALAQDRFALQPSAHDNLIVFGSKGERVAELHVPTISQSVTVGSTTFQISYGRDANDLLTAIIAPNSSQPQDLHFNVLNKNVDADKQAVITLTFPDSSRVTIDPGYIGAVAVNSHTIKHRTMAEDTYTPRAVPPEPHATASLEPRDIPPGTYEPRPIASTPSHAGIPASQIASSSDDSGSLPPSSSATASSSQPLYWSEPVTPLHGPAPSVAANEMKLVNVHGSVTVTTASGNEIAGREGMVVPSGSKISTDDDASAAVFMGGVNSARFMPESEAVVSQNLSGSVRKTDINLTKGAVFSRVGRRSGESQDYKVITPQGVAAARGTEYATVVVKIGGVPTTLSYVKNSTVVYKDANGNVTSISPRGPDEIAVGGSGNISPDVEKGILIGLLQELQQFNTQINAIGAALKNDPGSVSHQDRQWYRNNKDLVGVATRLYDVTNDTLIQLFGPNPEGTTTTHNGNTTTTSTTTFEGNSVIVTAVTTDTTTGATVKTVTTTTTTNPDGTITIVIVTTDADGNSTTTTQTTNPRPASGTLNAILNEFEGAPPLTPH